MIVVVVALLLGGVRWLFPERPMDCTGPRALLDAGFALGFLGLVLLVAAGLGHKVQRWLRLAGLTPLEQWVFGLPLGLGVLAYGILALGLIGLLRPWAIMLWLVMSGVWSWREWTETLDRSPACLMRQAQALKGLGVGRKALLALAGLIIALTLLQTLTPPWDTDGLMYHLQGPRLFLQAGRILLLPDTWSANGPFTLEMLFTMGLAAGSDTFAKLVHLTYALLLVLGTFAFGRRMLDPGAGWTSAAILIGIPILPVWASLAYVDIGWALYEFLAVYAFALWVQNDRRQWLALSGVAIGLALGSKYMALGGAAVLGLGVLWRSRGRGWKAMLAHAALFGSIALLVGSPWYVKNWLWGGNPVYPLFLGGVGWAAERVKLHTVYHRSFGAGYSLANYLLLPWNLYAQHERFGTFKGSVEVPSLLFPLALLYPFTRRFRTMDHVAWVALLRFVLWSLGSQQIRLLLPIFPVLSVLTGGVMLNLATWPAVRRWGQAIAAGLTGGMVVTTLVYSLLFVRTVRPLEVVSGVESKDAFLRRVVPDYPGLHFAQATLPPQARVFMMWDGRGYYCDRRCLPDVDHSGWTRLVLSDSRVPSVADSLRAMGAHYLLFSIEDADFILQHDPTEQHLQAAEFFLQSFRQACTREIYRDEWVQLFELTCP